MDAEVGSSTAAVVALKAGEFAKSRLGGLPDPVRRRLAHTMSLDTLTALSAALDHVLVVSDQPQLSSRLKRAGLGVEVVPEDGPAGLNGALRRGDELLRRRGIGTVLGCVGDLPALRPETVRRVLLAVGHPRSYVADASGVGTTMLIAHGVPLDPRFQGRSAAAHHSSGAVPLSPDPAERSWADARRDVDTEVDLFDAIGLGLGSASAALLDPATSRLGRYTVVTATERTDATGLVLGVTASGHRIPLPPEAWADGLRHVRPGQRLHAVISPQRVLSAWL